MNGVEILSSAQVVAETTYNATAVWIVVCVIIGICVTLGVVLGVRNNDGSIFALLAVLGIILAGISASIAYGVTTTPTSYETHYKVTIDDSVSMNDFLDKYEILDQEGKIYTVKERE